MQRRQLFCKLAQVGLMHSIAREDMVLVGMSSLLFYDYIKAIDIADVAVSDDVFDHIVETLQLTHIETKSFVVEDTAYNLECVVYDKIRFMKGYPIIGSLRNHRSFKIESKNMALSHFNIIKEISHEHMCTG